MHAQAMGIDRSSSGSSSGSSSTVKMWVIFAGKGWELACYVITPVLYLLIKLHMRQECKLEGSALITASAQNAVRGPDRKLVFVPLVFVLLRMWGTLRFFLRVGQSSYRNSFFITVMQAIGDSSQGFANGVLFCIFTSKVRQHLLDLLPFRRRAPKSKYEPLRSAYSSRNATNTSARSGFSESL
eukprot:m.99207 g.99207  ORF g.99207 m.99207 type:complete len:184 (+) comp15581_c0_seq2:67-618(+)